MPTALFNFANTNTAEDWLCLSGSVYHSNMPKPIFMRVGVGTALQELIAIAIFFSVFAAPTLKSYNKMRTVD